MDIIFNDLSLHSSQNTSEAWDCFSQFIALIDVLRENGCGKLLCRKDIQNESVCGLKIYDYLHELGMPQKQCTIDNSKKTFVHSIYVNYLSRILELDNAADYFSLNRDDNDKSTSVAFAINHEYPVASVPLDPVFKVNPLKGYKNNSQKVECVNFYDKDQEDLLSFILVPAKEQKKIDAKKHPIWNCEPTEKYLNKIKALEPSATVQERTAFIKEHCTRIAELNGWKFDKNIRIKIELMGD